MCIRDRLIAESYDILRRVGGLSVEECAEVFKEWNQGELDSYLIEITADILTKKDPETGRPMVDVIMDTAGNKGTGKWASQSALDLGVPLPLITESVFARFVSTLKEERVAASKELAATKIPELTNSERQALIEQVRKGNTTQNYKVLEDRVLRHLKNVGVNKLDFVLGTHVHSDHIGGVDEVLNHYSVEKLYLKRYSDNSCLLYTSMESRRIR